MLLWAETNYDKSMWVNALSSLMQSADHTSGLAVDLPKTKKNKFVLELINFL